MKKPLIGLIPLWDDEKGSVWMLPGYMEGVIAAGGTPIILPYTNNKEQILQVCELCQGFLLTGGQDVDPAVYQCERLTICGELCPTRDQLEGFVLSYAIEHQIPVLGICRGHQFINAWLGGTLYQDLPQELPSGVCHRQPAPYHLPAHRVRLIKGSPLAKAVGRDSIEVNSCHHQGIKELAPGLAPMAVAEDGLIESVWMPEHPFLWGVQWHPEFAWNSQAHCMSTFQFFIAAADLLC